VKRTPTTFGLDSDRLAWLLAVGTEAEEDSGAALDQAKGDLLRARLGGLLPVEPDDRDPEGAAWGQLMQEALPLGGRSLGEVLLDRRTGPGTLETIKDYAKRLGKDPEPSRSVALAIYFAAIAAALLYHDLKITRHGYPALVKALGKLAEAPWMPRRLAGHFRRGRDLCSQRAG